MRERKDIPVSLILRFFGEFSSIISYIVTMLETGILQIKYNITLLDIALIKFYKFKR